VRLNGECWQLFSGFPIVGYIISEAEKLTRTIECDDTNERFLSIVWVSVNGTFSVNSKRLRVFDASVFPEDWLYRLT
jgi:hypothetical protein